MKKYLIVTFLFLTINLSAQTNYRITYDLYNNTEIPNTLKGYLLFNTDTNKSIFKSDFTTRKQLKEEINGVKKILIKPKEGIDEYIIVSNDTIQELRLLGKIYVNVIDVNKGQNWKISNETKTIDKYKVIKATCTFRGRNWEAWFTPDIPLLVGPWKFRGLPGLIIQIFDESKRFSYNLANIEISEDIKIDKEVNNLLKNKIKKLTIKEFIEKEEESRTNTLNSLLGDRESYTRVKGPKKGKELIYEWEEEAKK